MLCLKAYFYMNESLVDMIKQQFNLCVCDANTKERLIVHRHRNLEEAIEY